MKGVLTRTREAWVKRAFGTGARFTVKQFQRARMRLVERGFVFAGDIDGPALGQVTAVSSESRCFPLVSQYRDGSRRFRRDDVTHAVGAPIDSFEGARRLATIGFALRDADINYVELCAADAREARLVNETRLGRASRGVGTRRIIESVLSVRSSKRSRVNITETRCILAAETLEERWAINGESLLNCGKRARLQSKWTFKDFNGNAGGTEPAKS